MQRITLLVTLGVLCFLTKASTLAYDQPSVNLGFTSFLDGAPPAGPGFYFTEYLQFYTADKLADADGKTIRIPNVNGVLKQPELDVFVSLNQFIYQSDQKVLLGGKWGLDVIVPVVWFDLDQKNIAGVGDNGTGIGDVLVGPYLQWDPIMLGERPFFMHRVELQCITPTGRYNDDQALNPGANFFSFDPYWAATIFPTAKWSISWRIHYLWNDENSDPHAVLPYPGARNYQAGQAVHLNWATEYEVIAKRLRLGLNGYYLRQITDSEVNGRNVDDVLIPGGNNIGGREEVIGIGPGGVYHFSPNDHLFLNSYFELGARNRTEGQRVVLRWVHHF